MVEGIEMWFADNLTWQTVKEFVTTLAKLLVFEMLFSKCFGRKSRSEVRLGFSRCWNPSPQIQSGSISQHFGGDRFLHLKQWTGLRSFGSDDGNAEKNVIWNQYLRTIISILFLSWKKGSSSPVTHWRKLVSSDWSWHSHGSVIPEKFDRKIYRSMKKVYEKALTGI